MKRITTTPRDNWESKVAEKGLVFHTLSNGTPYWNESAYYDFDFIEVDFLEKATNTLQEMCLEAGQYIIDNNLFHKMGIPDAAIPLIKWSWEAEPPAIYGRFDLSYDGVNPPKLLEYNADTPTSLLEASVVQWYWLQDKFPHRDQFNSIHERLVVKWKELDNYMESPLYFTHVDDDSLEDLMTANYLMDTAYEAGLKVKNILVKDIGWNGESFTDLQDNQINSIFKLYPWEWLVHEQFGSHILRIYKSMTWIEPIWKMMFSNKGILPVLWKIYPNHPNLLPAFFEGEGTLTDYIRKPLLSREGANIRMVKNGEMVKETTGEYGEEGFIVQQLCSVEFEGHYPVIGSWVINGESAGIGIRESSNIITDNLSNFIPHVFS